MTPRQKLLNASIRLLVIHYHFCGSRAQLPEQKRQLAEQYIRAVVCWMDRATQTYWKQTTLEQQWKLIVDVARIAGKTAYADLPGIDKHIQARKLASVTLNRN